eukprot:766683-Hanusia_phi.AAC.9
MQVRASSMLACGNQECSRRFCEHCLLTHLNDDVDPMSSDAWSMLDGKVNLRLLLACPKKCCCSVNSCELSHRHCKAYRYRRRRAELASKRLSVAESWNKPNVVPGVNFGFVKYPKDAARGVLSDSATVKPGPPSSRGPSVARRGKVDVNAVLHDTLEDASDSDLEDVDNRLLLLSSHIVSAACRQSDISLRGQLARGLVHVEDRSPDEAYCQHLPQDCHGGCVKRSRLPCRLKGLADDLLGGMYGHMTRFGDSADLDHCEMLLGERACLACRSSLT